MKRNRFPFLSILFFFACALFFLFTAFRFSPYWVLRPYIPASAAKLIPADKAKSRLSASGSHNEIYIRMINGNADQSFWIDQIPVVIADYKRCVQSGKCPPAHYHDEFLKYFTNPIYGTFPVTFVSWYEAAEYCIAEGGNLPTVLQWEYAAGSTFANTYPWGENDPSYIYANYDGFFNGHTPAGWLPNGVSPFGLLDMAGNVREWTLNLHYADVERNLQTDFRAQNDIYQEAVSLTEQQMILKGGGAFDLPNYLKIRAYQSHPPYSAGFNRGFRCAYPAQSSE